MANQIINIELQKEIDSINMDVNETELPATSSTNHAATQTSPAEPDHEDEITIEVGVSQGVYYGQMMPQPLLSAEELASDLVSPSIYERRGFIIQFINNNANCSPTVIGGVRTSEKDVRKIPHFLSVNKRTVRNLAVINLHRHLRDTQCATAVAEFLNDEDYGMSFSMASLSPRGSTLNPSRRNEAPMFYCHLPGLVDPCYIAPLVEGGHDSAHVVNCYIHLLPASQRRNAVLAKAREAQSAAQANSVAARNEAARESPPTVPINYSNTLGPAFGNNSNRGKANRSRSDLRPRPYQHMNRQQQQYQQDAHQQHQNSPRQSSPPKATIGQAINLARAPKSKVIQSPPLPAVKPPSWVSGSPSKDLPNHL